MSFKTILWWLTSFMYFIFICVPIGVILYIALEVLYLFIFILRALKNKHLKSLEHGKATNFTISPEGIS